MLTEDLIEQISKSVYTYLTDGITETKLYIEGEPRDTSKFPEFMEIRMDGPWLRSSGSGTWLFEIDINVLIQTPSGDNLYALEKLAGKVIVLLAGDISITDETCSRLVTNNRQKLQFNRFGQIEADVPVLQGAVEARHEFTLEV